MRTLFGGLTLCLIALACTGCGSDPPATVGWPSWGDSAENTHFASLNSVNAANVGSLKLVWRRSEGPDASSWETFPLVIGRTMYFTTDTGTVEAVDAASGRPRWSYTPRVDFFASGQAGTVEPVSRGVAAGAGRVYEDTYDDQLIALDAHTGHPLWDVRVDDPERGYAENSPPVYWRGELILGGPSGDTSLRGFLAAFDARTGRRLWRTSTVPPGASYGGGHVWMPPVVDPRSGIVYAATGNPTPAFDAVARPGCDPWTDATVALDARTGAFLWGHTEVCSDSWDYDTNQAPAIFDIRVRGRIVRVVGDGNKAGFYTTLSARTGALIARTSELVPFTQPHRVPTRTGEVVCPGTSGGLEYGPPAYSPVTGDVYLTGIRQCMRYLIGSDGRGFPTPVGPATGMIAAIDPASGRVVWRKQLPSPAAGGALVTESGLVFAGADDGSLYAFAARTGRVVWRFDVGLRFGSAPIAYEVDGTEYIAVAAGGSALSGDGARGGGELFVFAVSRTSY